MALINKDMTPMLYKDMKPIDWMKPKHKRRKNKSGNSDLSSQLKWGKTWYTTVYDWTLEDDGTQNSCITELKDPEKNVLILQHDIFFSKNGKTKARKCFSSVETTDEIIKLIDEIPIENRHLYESIHPWSQFKPYFDFDFDFETKRKQGAPLIEKEVFEERCWNIIQCYFDFILKQCGVQMNANQVFISDGSASKKHSWHCVITCGKYYDGRVDLRNSMTRFEEYAKEQIGDDFVSSVYDKSVYNGGLRAFKTPLSSKPREAPGKQLRIQQPMWSPEQTEGDIRSHLVLLDKKQLASAEWTPLCFTENIPGLFEKSGQVTNKRPSVSMKTTSKRQCLPKKSTVDDPLIPKIREFIVNLVQAHEDADVNSVTVRDNGAIRFECRRKSFAKPCRFGGQHSSNRTFIVVVYRDTGYIIYYCLGPNRSHPALLGVAPREGDKMTLPEMLPTHLRFDTQTYVESEVAQNSALLFYKNNAEFRATQKVDLEDSRVVQWPEAIEVPKLEVPEGGTLQVVAGCSLGKSWRCREFIDSLPSDARIICISVRILHAYDMNRELEKYGFISYNDEDLRNRSHGTREDQLLSHRRIIISLQSLHLIKDILPPDLLVMDEIRSLCGIFGGKTLTNIYSIVALIRLYRTAKYRIALDADSELDGAVNDLLRGLKGSENIPITQWIFPKQTLKRTLRIGFKRQLHKDILDALEKYHDKVPIAIACGRKKDAKEYADFLSNKSGHKYYTYALYTGESCQKTKRIDFSDPDKAWEQKDAVIFTSCLTVGTDIRKTVFGKIFLHTCTKGATLRDLFQGLCRFGRFGENSLLDPIIEVCIDCIDPEIRKCREGMYTRSAEKKARHSKEKFGNKQKLKPLKPRAPPRTIESYFDEIEKQYKSRLMHTLACHAECSPLLENIVLQLSIDPFVLRLEAWNKWEQEVRNGRLHFDEFMMMAKHRGWNVIRANDDEDYLENPHLFAETSTLEDDQRIDKMNDIQKYEFVRDFVASEPDGNKPENFFNDCYGLRSKTTELSSREYALKQVFYNLGHFGYFPSNNNDYIRIAKHRENMKNHAMLRFSSLNSLMMITARALSPDSRESHPLLVDKASKIFQAGENLATFLGIPSLTNDNVSIPQNLVDQINAERQGNVTTNYEQTARQGNVTTNYEQTARQKSLLAIARDLGRIQCKKNDSLALLQHALRKFHMKADIHKSQHRSNSEGKVIRKYVVNAITIKCPNRDLQDEYLWPCKFCGSYIKCGQMDQHLKEHLNVGSST